ncbi:MAG: hypothetical protein CML66_29505 [Rhodobacteraceae bacterium]|nr:hypothetical protein [Paracoccaceae bacterium]MAY47727.1 hypothetical protein [Paracoccaceae bacterium]QEW19233.1 PA14 domain protein [Marinibacterium anthonyi]
MKKMIISAVAALGLMASAALAEVTLTPANPQPKGLKTGLSVTYAYPVDIKTLAQAKNALASAPEAGPPLSGLTYPDGGNLGKALTSKQVTSVAAAINGYIRFDEAGVYSLKFYTNDGLDMRIGGQRVGYETDRTPCSSTGNTKVNVPQAGWYDLTGLWFQRLSSSCLEMEWTTPSGKKGAVPNSVFGYK